jgi:hypothetical protein
LIHRRKIEIVFIILFGQNNIAFLNQLLYHPLAGSLDVAETVFGSRTVDNSRENRAAVIVIEPEQGVFLAGGETDSVLRFLLNYFPGLLIYQDLTLWMFFQPHFKEVGHLSSPQRIPYIDYR